jgi:hypothetical protein
MSSTYSILVSEDYGYSWEKTAANDIKSREEAIAELARFREIHPKKNRKIRYMIDEILPERPDPEFAYVVSWLEAFETGKAELVKWLNENYIGREFEGMNAAVAKAEFHSAYADGIVWVGFFNEKTPPDVNMYYKLSDLEQIKFKK